MTDPIRELLAEEGMSSERELEDVLLRMRAEATGVPPIPSAAVAALMPERTRRAPVWRRRPVVTGLIVLGSLGLGVGTAAASPEVRSAAQQVVQTVLGSIGSIGSVVAPSTSAPEPHATPTPFSTPTPSATTSDHPSATDHPGKGIGATTAPGKTGQMPTPSQRKTPPAAPPTHPAPAPSATGATHHP